MDFEKKREKLGLFVLLYYELVGNMAKFILNKKRQRMVKRNK